MKKLGLTQQAIIMLEEDKHILFEMSTLYKRRTKLPVNIWVDDIGKLRNVEHNLPRIKVQNNYSDKVQDDSFELSIDKNNPTILSGNCKLKNKDLNTVKQYIKGNFKYFMQAWNQDITVDELKDYLNY